MNVTLYGATGQIGTRILEELLQRGHSVTSVVRDPAKLASRERLTVIPGDVSDAAGLVAASQGADAL